tara:strand:+ start:277 stop:393 length:117 start_codon:yes stop_codon:yes gene_type:complete
MKLIYYNEWFLVDAMFPHSSTGAVSPFFRPYNLEDINV